MTDYFKRPTELYILELTRVVIQVFLYYPCLNPAGWLFFEADEAKLLNMPHIHVHGMKFIKRDKYFVLHTLSTRFNILKTAVFISSFPFLFSK